MSTIFVTGGAGFIGSNFIRYWLDRYPDDLAARACHEAFGLPVTISNCSNNLRSYQFPEKQNIALFDR